MKAQDPVAWMAPNGMVNPFKTGQFTQPLYPCPQKTEWVGLTEDEINEYRGRVGLIYVRQIENKLREKNHG